MYAHRRHLFGILVACAVGAFGVAASAAQSPQSNASTQGSQSATLTGCVEYGPRGYILATMDVPAHPDLSNEAALEREELAAAEHSYQLTPAKGEQLSRLVGDKVRVVGALNHVSNATSAGNSRAASGRGQTANAPAVDQLNASSVQKLSDSCGSQLTMFEM